MIALSDDADRGETGRPDLPNSHTAFLRMEPSYPTPRAPSSAMHHVDSTSFSTSSNQFESSPGSSTSGPLDSLAVVETMKNQLDSTIERLKSEKSVADHEVSVLRLLVSDLEARVSQLLAAQASEAAIFEKHSKEQDALVFDLQASLRKLCGDVAEVRVEPDATTDSLPSSRASMPLSKASNHILLKRIGVLEQYRDRSEDALDRHKRLVDTRVAAITAARDAAYSTVSSLQQECDAHRRLIAAQASDITKLVSQKQVVKQSLRYCEAQAATVEAAHARALENASSKARALESALACSQSRVLEVLQERDDALAELQTERSSRPQQATPVAQEALAIKDAKIAALVTRLAHTVESLDGEKRARATAEDALAAAIASHSAELELLLARAHAERDAAAREAADALAVAREDAGKALDALTQEHERNTTQLNARVVSAEASAHSSACEASAAIARADALAQEALQCREQLRAEAAERERAEGDLADAHTRRERAEGDLADARIVIEAQREDCALLKAELGRMLAGAGGEDVSLEESVDRTLGTDASIATSGIAVGSSVYTVNDESQVSSPAVASSLDTTVGSDGDIQSTFVSSLHTDSYFGSTVSPVQSMQPGSAAKVGFGGPLVVDAESTAPSRTPASALLQQSLSEVDGSKFSGSDEGEELSPETVPPPQSTLTEGPKVTLSVANVLSLPDTCVMGIDVGTTSVKVAIVARSGEVMATASMPTHAYVPTTGDSTHAEQDVRRILQCLVSCLRALPAPLLTRVVRIGVAGQMHGVLLWRGDGSASHLITWEDRRVTPEFIEDLARDHPDLSGSLLALRSGYGCATLAHLATQSPDVLSGYEHCGSVMDFVVCTLCGVQDVKPVMEPTTAQSWGLFDATAGDWDWTALEVCGIPANLPPPIVHEATVVGTVSERVCAEWGLHIGPPGGVCEVFVAHGDHPCTVLASLRDGAAVAVSFGTSAQCAAPIPTSSLSGLTSAYGSPSRLSPQLLFACRAVIILLALLVGVACGVVDWPVFFGLACLYMLVEVLSAPAGVPPGGPPGIPSLPGWEVRPYFHGKSLIVAAAINGGNAIAELVHGVQSWAQFATPDGVSPRVMGEGDLYLKLEQTVTDSVDAGSLVFAPTFIPERNDPSGCQASVRGLGPGRLSDPVLLYAALVKGLAANLVALLPEQVRKNARGKPLAVSGGAVTHSPQLQAALASALHSGDLHVCHDADAATGAALLHLGQALDDPSSSSSSSSPSKPLVSLEEHVLKDEAKSSSARLPTRRKLATTKIA